MACRQMAGVSWLLVVIAVVWAGGVPVRAQEDVLGPWERSTFGIGANPLWPSSDGTTYGLSGGLHRTDDDGMTFTKVNVPANAIVLNVAVDPNDRNRVYVAMNNRVYRSEDGGAIWTSVYELAPEVEFKDANGRTERKTIERVETLAVSPADAQLLYMRVLTVDFLFGSRGAPATSATALRLMRSHDGGSTWEVMLATPVSGCGGYGMYLHPHALYPHPKDARRVFRAEPCEVSDLTERGVWVSEDQAATWTLSLGVEGAAAVQVIAGGDADADRLYARLSQQAADSEANPFRVLYRSDDGGQTWAPLPLLLASSPAERVGRAFVTGLAVRAGAVDRVFLYAEGRGGTENRLYNSADSGTTWTREPTEQRIAPSGAPVVSGNGRYLLIPGSQAFWRREVR
jgi:hypothetical protein